MANEQTESTTFVQRITDIPIIGEYITTLLALGPPVIPPFMLFGSSEDTPGTMLLFAILSVPWILWLQRKARIIVCLPHIRIPIIYATPVWFAIGIAKLF